MTATKPKRQLIVEAAALEFQERGFESASMDRITERAGVSKRTVYNHFESKAALFQDVISVMAERLKADVRIRYSPDRPIREQLLELGMAKGKLLRSKQFMQFVRMAMSETLRDPNMSHDLKQKSETVGEYRQFFDDAVKAGALVASEPGKVEDQFIGLIKAQAFWPAIFSGTVLDEQHMRQVVEESSDTIIAAYQPNQV